MIDIINSNTLVNQNNENVFEVELINSIGKGEIISEKAQPYVKIVYMSIRNKKNICNSNPILSFNTFYNYKEVEYNGLRGSN